MSTKLDSVKETVVEAFAMYAVANGGMTLSLLEPLAYYMPSIHTHPMFIEVSNYFEAGYFVGEDQFVDSLFVDISPENVNPAVEMFYVLKDALPSIFASYVRGDNGASHNEHFLGFWWNQETTSWDIDLVRYFYGGQLENAVNFGADHDQAAIWDVAKDEAIYLTSDPEQ